MSPSKDLRSKVTRRELLGLIGIAGVAAVAGCDDDGGSPDTTVTPQAPTLSAEATTGVSGTPPPSALNCVLTPEMTEGPFFVDEGLNRSDITSDPSDGSVAAGTPLKLGLTVFSVEGDTCVPVSGAAVDIWHCDAEGLYSDVAANGTAGRKFLRGYQLTDENGACQFTTVYPGWYMGRAVHIHVKVRTDPDSAEGQEVTSQFFFDDALSEQVFAAGPYVDRGSPDTTNATDMIYQDGGRQMQVALTPEGEGYAGSFTLGLQMA
jgi:protocatechuate 3,4-dioxygenase beta subunit